ncbi:hypothetical protein BLNAU_5193 [Blattamonas nauphoetae]|uniref:Uncharacterized protein n=1 Tax=Blattamonas nauphoetae TaxID=2049346 RepID=A0ABQ9Y7N4_9EUKA|nr:hypothetical protein BLNAU_5193 [Blattamonas nauphoetae]
MSVLILILVWRFWVPPISNKFKQFKVGISIVTFSILLIFLFELFANHRLTNQLSIDQNSPIPTRARIPLKTLLAAQGVVIAFILPDSCTSQSSSPVQSHSHHTVKEHLRRLPMNMFFLSILLLPAFTALKGMQFIRIRWIFIPLPLFVIPPLLFDTERKTLSEHSGIGYIYLAAILVPYVGIFNLIGALIADGVISWSFYVATLPVFVPVLGWVGKNTQSQDKNQTTRS